MEVILTPVCPNCMHVFKNFKCEREMITPLLPPDRQFVAELPHYEYDPYICPKCGNVITGIAYSQLDEYGYSFDFNKIKERIEG